jgi:hypothetical protein
MAKRSRKFTALAWAAAASICGVTHASQLQAPGVADEGESRWHQANLPELKSDSASVGKAADRTVAFVARPSFALQPWPEGAVSSTTWQPLPTELPIVGTFATRARLPYLSPYLSAYDLTSRNDPSPVPLPASAGLLIAGLIAASILLGPIMRGPGFRRQQISPI